MKRIFFIVITLFIYSNLSAQNDYTKGFEAGYKKGWCHNKDIGCIPPVPPVPPVPSIGESLNSYTDGYNRGFQMGLDAGRSEDSKSASTRQRYQTAQPEFVEGTIYNPDFSRGGGYYGGGGYYSTDSYYGGGWELFEAIFRGEDPDVKVHFLIKIDANLTPKKIKKPSFSFLFEVKIKKQLFLEAGLTHYKGQMILDNKEREIEQLIFPLNIKYKIAKTENIIVPKAGIYYSKIQGIDDNIVSVFDERDERYYEYPLKKLSQFDIGTNIGIEFRLGNAILDIVYRQGFIDLVKYRDKNIRNSSLLIAMGVSF